MPLKSQKGSILIWLIVSFLIIGLLSGGLYYYLEIYNPAQYAKAILPIYDEIRTQQVGSSFQDVGDYEGALAALDQYETSFTNWRNQILALNPSPINNPPAFLTNSKRSQQIQEDFTMILDFFISNIAGAKEKAHFMIKAKQLFLLLRPDLTEYPPKAVPAGQGVPLPPPPNTVGEYLNVWEGRISQAKVVAADLFSEPQDLREVSFEELKSLWQQAEEGFDAVLSFLKTQDSNIPFSEVQKLIPPAEQAVYLKADKVDEFLPLLEKVLIRYSAENILKFQFSADSSTQSEFNLSAGRLDIAIKDIKAKYSQ